jgi:hypothetical protein
MVSGAVIAIVCLPALLTLVCFFEVLAGCFALRKWGTSSVVRRAPCHIGRPYLFQPITREWEYFPPSATFKPNSDPTTASSWSPITEMMGLPQLSGQQASKWRCVPILCAAARANALEFGVQHLRLNPPDVVVTMDADCRLGENALRHLSDSAMASGHPAQSLYLMLAPQNARHQEKERTLFAWRVRTGSGRLAWACLGYQLSFSAPGWLSRSVSSWAATSETARWPKIVL